MLIHVLKMRYIDFMRMELFQHIRSNAVIDVMLCHCRIAVAAGT